MQTQKETAMLMVEETEKSLSRARIMERYYQRLVSGDRKFFQILGQYQAQIKELETQLAFLNEVAAEDEARP